MELLFIYNANSGYLSGLFDSLHKSISPKTYPCKLCALTYGSFSMKEEWKSYLDSININKLFLHKDELGPEFDDIKLPAVVLRSGEDLKVLIDRDGFDKTDSINQLKSILDQKLVEHLS